MYQYTGEGAYIPGVKATDLSEAYFFGLPPALKASVKASHVYTLMWTLEDVVEADVLAGLNALNITDLTTLKSLSDEEILAVNGIGDITLAKIRGV